MKNSSLSILIFTLLLVSCKKAPAPHAEAEVDNYITKEIPASFMNFYERFHNDEEFQMEHIVFPLAGHEQDGVTLEKVAMQWLKEDWVLHRPFNSYGGTFTRDYTNLHGIVIEKIEDTGKTFSMERRFSFIQGNWQLIYYSTFEMEKE